MIGRSPRRRSKDNGPVPCGAAGEEPAAGGIPALPPALTPRASREDGDKDEPSPRASVARATRPDSLEDKLFKYKDYDL